jgi:hypothetical protein
MSRLGPDMSGITLWNPVKEPDKVGGDIGTEDLGLGWICLVQELDMSG